MHNTSLQTTVRFKELFIVAIVSADEMTALLYAVDVVGVGTDGLVNWTIRRKYVISRPRICNIERLQCVTSPAT